MHSRNKQLLPLFNEHQFRRTCQEGVPSAPLAHPSLRRLELDSDSDSEDENDGGQLGFTFSA